MKKRVSDLAALLVAFCILLAASLVAIAAWEHFVVRACSNELIGVEGKQ